MLNTENPWLNVITHLNLFLQVFSNASACHVSIISGKPEVHLMVKNDFKFYVGKLNNRNFPQGVRLILSLFSLQLNTKEQRKQTQN